VKSKISDDYHYIIPFDFVAEIVAYFILGYARGRGRIAYYIIIRCLL
jgi:hypothetical protein